MKLELVLFAALKGDESSMIVFLPVLIYSIRGVRKNYVRRSCQHQV